MLFKNSPEKFWNLFASKYAARPITDQTAYETKIKKIMTYLSPEYNMLDIGCGTGTQCADLAKHVKQVTGIDISSKLLNIANQRMQDRKLNNVKFIQTSIFDERFAANSFDVILAFYVLHFFDDIDTVFSRIHSLLRPGGLFISETACLGEKSKLVGKLIRLSGQAGILPVINLLTTVQLEQALNRSGFMLHHKQVFTRADSEYTLFARKV